MMKAAPRKALAGHCRELGCDMVVVTQSTVVTILHIHADRVHTYHPTDEMLDDLSFDIWDDVKHWAEGLHG